MGRLRTDRGRSLSASRKHAGNQMSRRPRGYAPRWDHWMRCEELERRTLLTAIPASVETATLDVLAALRDDVRSAISNHVILQTQLPVIGASIADDLDLQTILSAGLYDPINTYLSGAPT